MHRRNILLLFMGLWAGGIWGQPLALLDTLPPVDAVAFPTYYALLESVVPPADRATIATQFLGYQPMPAPHKPLHQVGDSKFFNVQNSATNQRARIVANVQASGAHVVVWVEDGNAPTPDKLEAFVAGFDTRVYAQTRALWGQEARNGVDGDPRVHVLLTRFINPATSAYFSSQHSYPRGVFPDSNEHDMLIMNLHEFEREGSIPRALSVAAHEFQHMIRHHIDSNEATWLDEGFALFTEYALGLDENTWLVNAFLGTPDVPLTQWTSDAPRAALYGSALLFVRYFYERFGEEALHALSTEEADGFAGVERVLRGMGHEGFDVLFADWVLANLLQRPELGFGYGNRLGGVRLQASVTSYPFSTQATAYQYGTHYYAFNLLDQPTLVLTLAMPAEALILPEATPDGVRYWYSNAGDNSHTTLTRAFDLRDVETATLRFWAWYDLETFWDYGYVSVSTDGGATWTPQRTRHTTQENPNGRAIGEGFTGVSGAWREDAVTLDAYVGREVLVRFEALTDDAITHTGIGLDAVALPEIGYFADFETDDGGWVSAGWVLSDNRLPQRAWVQVAQHHGNAVTLSRFMAEGDSAYTITLVDGVEHVTLALSPFAPVTTIPMPYRLVVE